LSAAEREEFSRGLAGGFSSRQIAAAIARSHTTVSREVARNGGREGYRAAVADAACGERARRPEAAKLASNAAVEQRLEEKWSPQQIAGWLGRTYPESRRSSPARPTH
jgi:IS30 family transposase